MQSELALALATTEKDVENSQARIDNLKRQQQQFEERLERLARIRAEHDYLNNEVRSRTRIHQEAEKQLAEARASRDAALSSSLLTRLDEPVLGERPAGPGRSTIVVGTTLAGLFFGLGIVFLLTPLDGEVAQSDRWNERLGRRISDRFPWLADADANASAPRRRRSDQNRRQSDRSAAPRLTPSEISAMAPTPAPQAPRSQATVHHPVGLQEAGLQETVLPGTMAPEKTSPNVKMPSASNAPQRPRLVQPLTSPAQASAAPIGGEPKPLLGGEPTAFPGVLEAPGTGGLGGIAPANPSLPETLGFRQSV